MLLREMQKHLLLSEEEIIINRTFEVRGRKAVLAALMRQGEKITLWMLADNLHCNTAEASSPGVHTNREEALRSMRDSVPSMFLKKLIFQDQEITFNGGGYGVLSETNWPHIAELQHLYEKGVDMSLFADTDISDIVLCSYTAESQEFPSRELFEHCNLSLTFGDEWYSLPIEQIITLEVDEDAFDERLSFWDSEENCPRYFYINGLRRHDIWQEMDDNMEKMMQMTMEYQQLSREEAETQIRQGFAHLEEFCPRGMALAVVEYETEDGLQLQFYEKSHLDAEPKYSNSGVSFLSASSEQKEGRHGYTLQTCVIHPCLIPRDFKGQITIELLSWAKRVPEETVIL